VVVDLSELAFADATLMLDLAVLARRLRVRGRAVFLHKPQPQVKTLIEVMGLHRLPGVRLGLPRGRTELRDAASQVAPA
jgi:anti-anti-sigma regulatory factor